MANFNYYKRKVLAWSYSEWIIGVNVFMFILTQIINLSMGNGLLRLGAKVNFLIAFGEYWRLFTAMFLHADLIHLFFNMVILYMLGRDIERFFGPKKFLAIYFLSGLMGSAASYIFTANMSVGASGAIFGLMGANLYLYKINPTAYKRLYGTDLLLLIGLNIFISFIRPNIDIAGHLGGLLGGFLMAYGVGLSFQKAFVPKRMLFQGLVVLLILTQVIGGTLMIRQSPSNYIVAVRYYQSRGREQKAQRIAQRAIEKFPNEFR